MKWVSCQRLLDTNLDQIGLEIPAGIRYSKYKVRSFYSKPIYIRICIHIKSGQRIPMTKIWMTN